MRDEESRNAIVAPSRSWRGPRPGSLAFSLLLHSALAFVLLWFSGATQEPSLYEQVIQPHENHIVWYPLKEIPKISSPESGEAKAETLNRDTIIHRAPDAAHDNRLVWRTPNRAEPEKKTPAPDMIAVERGADPRITVPPARTPKSFVAPPPPPPAQTARIKLAEPPPPEIPKLAIPDAGLAALTDSKVKFSRRFVAPPPVKKPAEGDAGAAIAMPEAPALPGSGGASDINALIVNSVHFGGIDAAPPRQSAISAGPNVGTGSGNGGKGGIQIPGVTVAPGAGRPESAEATLRLPKESGKGAPAPAAAPPQVFVAPRIAPLEHTLSAPLPPSSRNVPKLIEARFAGRIVYTMLLPMKGVPGYAGDWTIWFAERQRDVAGTAAPIRAPLPVRKPAQQDPALATPAGEVQLAARVTIAGKIDSVSVIGSATTTAEAAIRDLESWQFLPALRNREPVEVDLIINIPFGISAKPGTPPIVPVLTEVDRSKGSQHN
jgi:hypothetical protein